MNNETLLQHLYNTAPLLIGIITLEENDYVYVKANKRAQEFLGKPEVEIINHRASELGVPEEFINLWIEKCLEAEKLNIAVPFSYERIALKGKTYFSSNAIYLGEGIESKKYYAFIIEDITEKRLAHLENARLLSDFNAILNATNEVAITSTDMSGTLTFFNKGAENMLGYKAEEVVGLHTPKLFHTKEEVTNRENEAAAKAVTAPLEKHAIFASNKFESSEFFYVNREGKHIPVQLIVTPKTDIGGNHIGYVGFATDISKIKAVEDELAAANKELESFAYVVSHDLQEPLRVIKGFIALLEKKYISKLDEAAQTYMGFITDGAKRMQELIKDILEYSRQSKATHEFEEVDLDKILKEISYLFSVGGIKPDIEYGVIPTIKANKIAMSQLFTNLIGNAVKYQPVGNKPIIRIEALDKNNFWEFSVSDNGIGIEKENYNRVFAIFQRVNSKEKYSGTGIGLSICQKIVNHHKGKIWIEPSLLGGSTFKFTIAKLN